MGSGGARMAADGVSAFSNTQGRQDDATRKGSGVAQRTGSVHFRIRRAGRTSVLGKTGRAREGEKVVP